MTIRYALPLSNKIEKVPAVMSRPFTFHPKGVLKTEVRNEQQGWMPEGQVDIVAGVEGMY